MTYTFLKLKAVQVNLIMDVIFLGALNFVHERTMIDTPYLK